MGVDERGEQAGKTLNVVEFLYCVLDLMHKFTNVRRRRSAYKRVGKKGKSFGKARAFRKKGGKQGRVIRRPGGSSSSVGKGYGEERLHKHPHRGVPAPAFRGTDNKKKRTDYEQGWIAGEL